MPEMVKLNASSIENGLMPAERIARVQDASGATEEITVSPGNVKDNRLVVHVIGVQGDRILVELPRESASGRWRIWVDRANAIGL